MNPRLDHTDDNGIQKAAILVSCLDRATADAVLQRLGPDQAQRVRRLLVDLPKIDPQEQRRVIDEFFHGRPKPAAESPTGIELDGRLARRLPVRQEPAAAEPPSSLLPPDPQPFRFLHEAEADKLARVLSSERPQTVALVLSHLPPDQAGSILVRLQPAFQTEVVHRLVDLEETDPQVLREVEQALESRLSQHVRMQRRRMAGMQAIASILRASDSRVGIKILDSLAAHDQALAEQLSPPAVHFDDLAQLEDAALGTVFHAADPELLMTALVGAPPRLIDRVLQRYPLPRAEAVRRRLDHPGPIRLSDVEDARRQIAELARHLAMEGRISLPNCQPTFVS